MNRRTQRGLLMLGTLLVASGLAAFWWPPGTRVPQPPVNVALVDPYAHAPLEAYGRVQDLLRSGDLVGLGALADGLDGYLAYRVARMLAENPTVPPAERLRWYERVLELRIQDPLERAARRALHAEIGAVAEAAGATARAVAAYREGLPNQAAIDGIERLESDPYRRANAFLQANMATRALAALDGRAAPSLEAPALRTLGRHGEALAAFRRWLAEVPGDRSALEGEAWSLFSLERWAAAEAAFAALGGATGAYGRGLVAGREGRIDDGVAHLLATGQASRMWIASGWLEGRGRATDAIEVYLRIAATGDRTYADDAAYRAWVLARRAGNADVAARALALLPENSFFALLLGGSLNVPTAPISTSDPMDASAEAAAALAIARSLQIVHDTEAARGELLFALRDAAARADAGGQLEAAAREDVIVLAETLQAHHGEFRQSQRAAQTLLNAGDRDPRVWRLAYPQAYPASVETHAATFGIEPALVWAVMRQESAFSPVAVSTSNAQGLMQVIPSTWSWLAELKREPPGDPFDPDTNVRYGAYYLRWLLDYFDGDLELAIASYNRGQGYIRRLFTGDVVAGDKDELYRYIDALETREYLQLVTLHLETYRTLYGAEEPVTTLPPQASER